MTDMPEKQGAAASQGQETVTSPQGEQQTQLRVDDSQAQTYYSSISRISGSAEEITLDFAQGVRPTDQSNVNVLRVNSRIILSPWAAKRLAMALGQTVQRYEQAYGTLEIDPRKRQQQQEQTSSTTGTG